MMAAIARAPTDTPTVDVWAALVRMSRSTLEHRCRVAGARPKDALALGRLLRATSVSDPGNWRPEDGLDVLDHRTLVDLLTRGGVVTHWHNRRPEVSELFANHAFEVPAASLEILAAWFDDEDEA
jgi:hypothetical protein